MQTQRTAGFVGRRMALTVAEAREVLIEKLRERP